VTDWISGTHLRAAGVAIVTGALALWVAGCGSTAIPSHSGSVASTLGAVTTQASTTTTPQTAKRFNPFVDHTERSGGRVVIENPSMSDVMRPGPLPERFVGREDAPVTVIKYASLTCPYCRKFHLETFPLLKKRYIDTGKMRFILREFPIGFQSGAATIALRCVPAKHYFSAYGALLEAQSRWVSQEVRREPIWQIVRKFGLTRAAFDACYEDKKLVADLNAVKERGRTLGVIGTPNFYIGNKLYKRVLTMTDFDAAMSGTPIAGASTSSLPNGTPH
jgi:protein-disulfide isomerase